MSVAKLRKRKRAEERCGMVEKKIEEVANRSDQRIGHMIIDVITKIKDYERIRGI